MEESCSVFRLPFSVPVKTAVVSRAMAEAHFLMWPCCLIPQKHFEVQTLWEGKPFHSSSPSLSSFLKFLLGKVSEARILVILYSSSTWYDYEELIFFLCSVIREWSAMDCKQAHCLGCYYFLKFRVIQCIVLPKFLLFCIIKII